MKDFVPVFLPVVGEDGGALYKTAAEAKYLLEDTYLIPNTIHRF